MAGTGARVAKIVAIFVVVWAVVLVGLDRGGLYLAEYEAAKAIQDSQHLPSRPDVELAGIPFLTQLIEGEFGHVSVDAQGVVVTPRGRSLRVAEMDVDLRDVSVSRTFRTFHADRAHATALITYTDLGNTVGASLQYKPTGQVQGTKSLLGLTATISAEPSLVGQSLHFSHVRASVPGGLSGVTSSLAQRLSAHNLPLTGLPFGLRITGMTVAPDGVHLTLRGTDISYTG